MEVKDNLSKAQFKLTEELEVVLTMDEKAEQSNVYRTYQEDEQRLITNHGKVYTLTLGQCTQTLAIATNSQDRVALREKMEVEDNLSKAQFELTEELEVVLMMDKKAEQSNVYRTYQEDEQRHITNRGKLYML